MERKLQLRLQKFVDVRKQIFHMRTVRMKDHEIISISDVVSHFKLPFHKLIELVHVHVHEQLTCEITERQPYVACAIYTEAVDNLLKEPERIFIVDSATENIHQNLVIDIGKKLPNVALEHPRRARVIPGGRTRELPKAIHCFVRPFPFAAGIGVVNEQAIKKRIELPVESVVHQTILHGCFMNMAWFGIVDAEGVVRAMPIRLLLQLLVKGNDAICEMH